MTGVCDVVEQAEQRYHDGRHATATMLHKALNHYGPTNKLSGEGGKEAGTGGGSELEGERGRYGEGVYERGRKVVSKWVDMHTFSPGVIS